MDFKLNTGALDSPKDDRDWTLASAGAPTAYPTSCFIDQEWMIPAMQGQRGSCVGNTAEEVVRQIIYLTTGVKHNPDTENELSWRFVYALAKSLEGTSGYEQWWRTTGADDGTYPSLVAKIIRTYGVPLAKYCPNNINLSADEFCYHRSLMNIPQQAFADALKRRSGADFAEPVSIEGIKKAINYAKANKGGVMILRRMGNTYWTDVNGTSTWDPAKLLPIRVPKTVTGGHEEFLYGYDEEPGTGRIRIYWLNHWSKDWANNGRGWEYADEWLPLINELRVVVASVPVVDTFRYHFKNILKKGMSGPDVVALQHALKLEGCFPTTQAFTGYFGSITLAGVKSFQLKYKDEILLPSGLSAPTGYVGQFTLAKLNSIYAVI